MNHLRARRWLRRGMGGLLAFVLAASLFAPCAGVQAQAATSKEIQKEIDDLNGQKNEIQGRMNEIQSEIDSLDYEKANTLEKKEILDQRNMLAQEELDVIQEQIDITDGLMESVREDLEDARREEEYQKQLWMSRLRAMEESSDVGYLEVLFDATSFSDLLTRLDMVNEVMDYDESLEQQYIAARQKVEVLEAQAETMFKENEARRTEQEAKKAQLEADIAAACALIASMEQDTADYEAVLAQEAATQAEIQALIIDKEKELQAAKAKEEAARLAALAAQQAALGLSANTANYVADGTTWMMWPSYTKYLTSRFGPRYLSLYGYVRSHNGVDIGASYGSAIWSAAGGTVVSAGWNGGYGKCVIVNHGNGYTTVYGHMSRIAVSAGQSVSMGSVLGYVGSTGNSTGPHLHFEIRASATATPINPMAFTYFS